MRFHVQTSKTDGIWYYSVEKNVDDSFYQGANNELISRKSITDLERKQEHVLFVVQFTGQ